jgi:ribosomal protein S18 acetylase RimI-like enzyme
MQSFPEKKNEMISHNNPILNIRPAMKSDKEQVLRFCVNTFEWGDYIDQVWDLWYSDRNGVLLVAEDEEYSIHNKKRPSIVGVSHVSFCPNNKNIWLEGVRVNPNFRRRSVATQLLNKMISYGKEHGAKEASAMVGDNNIASQLMMQENRFAVISKWSYYSSNKIPKRADKIKLRSKVATFKDREMICNYLRQSEVYKLSGETYVNSWRWYSLDLYSNTLPHLIKNERVLVIGNDPIEGVAIINKDREWYKSNNNTFQIVYLDASNVCSLEDIINFAINLIQLENVRYDKMQVYSPQTTYLSSVIEQLGLDRSEVCLLYKRKI